MSLTEFRLPMTATRQVAVPLCNPRYQASARNEAILELWFNSLEPRPISMTDKQMLGLWTEF